MEELSMNNILDQSDIENLFFDESDDSNKETSQETSPEINEEKKKTTEEISTDTLFEETPESVGSDKHQEGEDTTSNKPSSSSPNNNNFYSSIAKALKEDGVFPDLDDETADNIKEPEDFAEAIEKQIQLRLDEKQRRIDEALNAGVEGTVIKQYENTLDYLDSITEEALTAEDSNGENLRKQLIYQDLLNKGYSKEDAKEELSEIFENGTDIKKAKRALAGNIQFFKKGYQDILDAAKEEANKEEEERKNQAATLRKSILEDKEFLGEVQVDKATRQKIFDNISKPVYKDKDTGELYTAIQKYEKENKTEFLKNVGVIFTLTDGFKNLNKLVSPKVKKEVNKNIRELEKTLTNTTRLSDGNLKFVSNVDSSSFSSKWDLDI